MIKLGHEHPYYFPVFSSIPVAFTVCLCSFCDIFDLLSQSVSDNLNWIVLSQSQSYWSVDTETHQPPSPQCRSAPSTTCCLCLSSWLPLWAFISKYFSSSLDKDTHTHTHTQTLRHLHQISEHLSSEKRTLFSVGLDLRWRLNTKIIRWDTKKMHFWLATGSFSANRNVMFYFTLCYWYCGAACLWEMYCISSLECNVPFF